MRKIAIALIVFVAIEHLGFLVLEIFLWTSPIAIVQGGPAFAALVLLVLSRRGLLKT